MSRLPNVGVFGSNSKSEYLVNCLIKNGFKVTAIWSDCIEEARSFAKRFRIDFYTDKIDVLLLKKEVELILINCQQIHYVQIVTKAFRIGKHVLCDWPSNLTVNELNKMCEAASYYPSLISIYPFPLRFLPQFKLLRNLILEQNYIGDITLINVNINGRNLIELDDIDQLINQTNCIYCKDSKLTDCKSNELAKSEEPSSIEKTDESSIEIEDRSVDSHKVNALNEKNKENNHKSTHQDPVHQTHLNRKKSAVSQNGTLKQPVNKLPINLVKKLEINSQDNQKYKDTMKEGGILNSLGPHVIDIISFVTNLKAKKCNGILRTFNSSLFLNELSLIKRINVDDFCTFQLQMDKMPSSPTKSSTKQVNIDEKRSNDKSSNNGQTTTLKPNKTAKELANNKPIAIVTLNDHLETLEKSYEIIIAGEFGYLRLKDGNLFGRQYEQNNNDGSSNLESLDEEKAFYLVKNNLKMDNFCLKHQDQEISKLIINNKHLFRPFKSGLENLIESVRSAFDSEPNTGDKVNNVQTKNDQKLTNGSDKMNDKAAKDPLNGQPNSLKENNVQNGRANDHSTVVQTNNERNLVKVEPLKEKPLQANKSSVKLIINSTSKTVVKCNGQQNGIQNGHLNNQNAIHKLAAGQQNKLSNEVRTDLSNGVKSVQQQQQNGVSNDQIKTDEKSILKKSPNANEPTIKQPIKANETTTNERCCNQLQRIKEAIGLASSFEDGKYVQSVIDAIRLSSSRCEWIRPQQHGGFVKQKQ